jgi:cyclopropane-fatty-acyl-phospholipid synthase
MMQVFEPHHYSILDLENLRLHYAKTLEHWLQRFEEHEDEIEKMFNQTFVRAWRLYLSGSIAAFDTGQLQLFQIHFTRERNNKIALTRDHIYQQTSKQKQSNG